MAERLVEGEPQESGLRGNVRIACIRSVATYVMPSAIEAVGREHPNVHVEVDDGCHDYGDVLMRLDDGGADIGITRGPVGAHLLSRPYISDPYMVIAPASVNLRSPVIWSELAHLPFIHIQQPGATWIVEQCRAAGCHQAPARRLVNESGVLALVARGLGFAVLPRLTAFPDVPGTRMLALPKPIRRNLVLVVRSAASDDACVGLVMRLLLDKNVASTSWAWRAGAFAFDY